MLGRDSRAQSDWAFNLQTYFTENWMFVPV